MTLRDKILAALQSGPISTEQVRELVGDEYRVVYSELHRMRGERLLQSRGGRGARGRAKMLVWRIRPVEAAA